MIDAIKAAFPDPGEVPVGLRSGRTGTLLHNLLSVMGCFREILLHAGPSALLFDQHPCIGLEDFAHACYERAGGNMRLLHRYIHEATLKDPCRLFIDEAFALIIGHSTERDFSDLLVTIEDEILAWHEVCHRPANFARDADLLPRSLFSTGLKTECRPMEPMDSSCPLCYTSYQAHPTYSKLRYVTTTPCGHDFCDRCLEQWRLQNRSRGRYTCPLCRACLVCGAQGCIDHQIHNIERFAPFPLQYFWWPCDNESSLRVCEKLAYRYLREATRYLRVQYAAAVADRLGEEFVASPADHNLERLGYNRSTGEQRLLNEIYGWVRKVQVEVNERFDLSVSLLEAAIAPLRVDQFSGIRTPIDTDGKPEYPWTRCRISDGAARLFWEWHFQWFVQHALV